MPEHLSGRASLGRASEDEPAEGEIGKRQELFAVAFATGAATDEEERNVGPDAKSDLMERLFGEIAAEGSEDGGSVAASTAETAFGRNALRHMDLLRGKLDIFADQAKGFGNGVLGGDALDGKGHFVLTGRAWLDCEFVSQFNLLKDRAEGVPASIVGRTNGKERVDLGGAGDLHQFKVDTSSEDAL